MGARWDFSIVSSCRCPQVVIRTNLLSGYFSCRRTHTVTAHIHIQVWTNTATTTSQLNYAPAHHAKNWEAVELPRSRSSPGSLQTVRRQVRQQPPPWRRRCCVARTAGTRRSRLTVTNDTLTVPWWEWCGLAHCHSQQTQKSLLGRAAILRRSLMYPPASHLHGVRKIKFV